MAGQQLYPENFAPNIVLPGQVQSFTFNRSLSQWQLINRFTPTLITSCDNLFEFINLNEAGYRFHHLTNISSQIGDFIFEKFNNGHIPGTPIFRIQESTGNFIFSLPSGGGLQLNNGTSVTPLQFYNSAGTHYAALQAGNLTSNITWTLPLTDSTGTQALVSNGGGQFGWATFGIGNVTSVSGTVGFITVANGTTTPVINIDPTYIGQTSIITLGTITTGTWNASILGLQYGGTNSNITASNGSVVYSTTSALALTTAPVINHQILMSIVGGAPIWSDIVYPNSILPGQLLYGFGTSEIRGLATGTNGVLVTDSSNMPSILSGPGISNQVLLSASSSSPLWSSATYPVSTTINQLLYSSAANTITGLVTANSSTLMTNSSGVPAWQTTASNFVTSITGTANQITCSASTGAVTLSLPSSVVISTSVQAGNLQLTANTLQSVNTNGNINITPNGTGITSITNNVGIGTPTPHSALQFSNSINNRIITLYETSNNNFQYYGFGIQESTLVYNVGEVTNLHAFYCGTSSTTSKELMRITATGGGNSGCVGINVGATPAAGLHVIGGVQNVSGEDSCIRAESANSNAKIEYKCTSGSGRLYETRSSSSGTWDLVDRTGSTEKFIVNTSGVGFGGSAVAPSYDGDCNGTFRAKKLLGNSNAPSASLGGTGVVGTGATSSIVGSEIGGRFTLNTGTGVLGVGTIATFTLASVMPSSTFSIIFYPANNNASGQIGNIFISSASSSTFTIANNGLLGLAASTTYIWNYQIVGY